MSRITALALALALALAACSPPQPTADAGSESGATPAVAANSADLPVAIVYKTPTCGCCKAWVEHMEENGFEVDVRDMSAAELQAKKNEHGVPAALTSCHTALIGRYVFEGHVPAGDIRKVLYEQPAIAGLGVPGMPMGSPGMEGPYREAYDVFAFTAQGAGEVYASH